MAKEAAKEGEVSRGLRTVITSLTLVLFGAALTLFGVGASWPIPTTTTEIEMGVGLVLLIAGLWRLIRLAFRSRKR